MPLTSFPSVEMGAYGGTSLVRSGPKEFETQLVRGKGGGNDSMDETKTAGLERNQDVIILCQCYFVVGMVLSVYHE